MVLRSVVERSISMSVVRRRISIARKSISTVESSGRGLSISVARRSISIPMARISISTIGSSGTSISIARRRISTIGSLSISVFISVAGGSIGRSEDCGAAIRGWSAAHTHIPEQKNYSHLKSFMFLKL